MSKREKYYGLPYFPNAQSAQHFEMKPFWVVPESVAKQHGPIDDAVEIVNPPVLSKSRNPERDEYIVRRHNDGIPLAEIALEINTEHKEWEGLESAQAVQQVLYRRGIKIKSHKPV
jgi:hypothetical protein